MWSFWIHLQLQMSDLILISYHWVNSATHICTRPQNINNKSMWKPELGPIHDDVIKWKHFPRYWPFVREIHRSPVNFPHKGQWRGALMFTLICARINSWVNNGEAGDLRRHPGHYDVIVMSPQISTLGFIFLFLSFLSPTVSSCFSFIIFSFCSFFLLPFYLLPFSHHTVTFFPVTPFPVTFFRGKIVTFFLFLYLHPGCYPFPVSFFLLFFSYPNCYFFPVTFFPVTFFPSTHRRCHHWHHVTL